MEAERSSGLNFSRLAYAKSTPTTDAESRAPAKKPTPEEADWKKEPVWRVPTDQWRFFG
jgi:hypothetical protein